MDAEAWFRVSLMFVHILEGYFMYLGPPVIRSYESYDTEGVSDDTGLFCADPSRAIQSQKDEADINVIVRNFGVTGKLPENVRVPSYGDFDYVGDYATAVAAIRDAEFSFMSLEAGVRARFDNDPQQFLEFCSDSGNLEEMRKLGLAVPKPDVSDSAPV